MLGKKGPHQAAAPQNRIARRLPEGKTPDFEAKVLVVGDSAIKRRVVVAQLSHWGCSVQEAAELAADANFDLIPTPLRMPNMGGIEAIEYIRRRAGSNQDTSAAGVYPEQFDLCLVVAMNPHIAETPSARGACGMRYRSCWGRGELAARLEET